VGAGAVLDGQPCTKHTPSQPVDAFCVADYSAHHQPFEYYASTSNPQHLPPSSVAAIGTTDQANHQYDLSDFWAAADSGHLPAVSFIKAAKFQDGHAGYSDPLDEQTFLVQTINHLEMLPTWQHTAVVISYDDSDGWYDHVMGPVLSESQTGVDALTAPGQCGASGAHAPSGQQGRCGLGPRLPLLVVSPWARRNFVDNTLTDQASIIHFVEDNWKLPGIGGGSWDRMSGSLSGMFDFAGRGEDGGDQGDGRGAHGGRLFLDPMTGEPQRPKS